MDKRPVDALPEGFELVDDQNSLPAGFELVEDTPAPQEQAAQAAPAKQRKENFFKRLARLHPIAMALRAMKPDSTERAVFDHFMQGATGNLADEATDRMGAGIAAAATGRPYSEILPEARASTQDRLERQRNEHPILSTAAGIAGSIIPGTAASRLPLVGRGMAQLARLPGIAGTAAQGAAVGAVTAPVYAAGAAREGARIDAAGDAVLPGAVSGAVAAPLAGAVGNVAQNALGPLASKAQAMIARKSAARQAIEKRLKMRPDIAQVARVAQERFKTGREMGIRPSLGEALGDEGLMADLATLKTLPETQGRVEAFLGDRRAAAPGAINRMIDDIDPVRTPDEAAKTLIGAAQGKIDTKWAGLRQAAEPHFEAARENLIPEDSDILKSIDVQRAIKEARRMFPDEIPAAEIPTGPDGKPLAPNVIAMLKKQGAIKDPFPDNSVGVLHHAKMVLDRRISEIEKEGGNQAATRIRYLNNKIAKLVGTLEEASPDYKAGMDLYRAQMPEIEALEKGRVGGLTSLRATGQETATRKLFEGTPTATREMVDAVGKPVARKAGAGELRRIADENKNDPLTFSSKVWGGTPSKAATEQWRTVLGDKFGPFAKKMDLIAAANRSAKFNEGSRTAPLLSGEGRLRSEAKAGEGLSSEGMVDSILRPLKLMPKIAAGLGKLARDPAAEAKYLNDFADYLTTDKAEELLATMNTATTPSTRKAALDALQAGFIGTEASEPLRVHVGTAPEINNKIKKD